MNFRLSGQKIELKSQTKQLGITLDEHMTFKKHLTILRQVLTRAYSIPAKLRYYIPTHVLKSLYYSLFDSHLKYASHIWEEEKNCYITAIKNVKIKP